MSLRVWLPLTKDLRQQGLDNVTVTNNGATFNSAGKLGGCYEFASGKRIQTTLPPTSSLNSKAISFACWINISSWNSSYDCLMSIADGTGWQQSRATLSRNNTASTLTWNIADGSTSTRVSTTTSLSTNTWYHIACTYDGASLKIYVNGTLDNSAAATLSIGYAGTFNIGGWSGNNYPINCKMNDVRVYSHCLSPMEVKELAKGLVLHYPLNRQGWGQENLATCTTPQYNLSAYTSNYNYFWIASAGTLTAGKTYTVSAEVTVSDNIERCTIYNYHTNPTTGGPQYDYFPADGKRHSWTFTASATGLLGYCGVAGATANHTAVYKNIKIEEGEIATPYIPRSNETLYITMGLNSTTEYDCSGFCNNGTRTGTFTWTSDTPKYAVSQVFNGSQYIVESNEINTTDSTIALWIKSALSANAHVLDARNSSEVGKQPIYQYTNGSIQAGGNNAYVTTNTGLLVANTWVHVALVQSGNSLLVYKNGTLFQTISCNNSPIIKPTIGARLNFSKKYTGQLSDIRIYATALSADDVKSLYQNCATIDPDGTIRGQIRS